MSTIAVVGDGILGTLLVHFLAGRGLSADWYTNCGTQFSSASLRSGGLVRGYTPDDWSTRHAAWSLEHYWRHSPNYWNLGSTTLTNYASKPSLQYLRQYHENFSVLESPPQIPGLQLDSLSSNVLYEQTAGFVDARRELNTIQLSLHEDELINIFPCARSITLSLPFSQIHHDGGTSTYGNIIVAAGNGTFALCPWIRRGNYFLKKISYSVFRLESPYSSFGIPCFVDEVSDTWLRPMPENGAEYILAGFGRNEEAGECFPVVSYDSFYGGNVIARLSNIVPWLSTAQLCYTIDSADVYRRTSHISVVQSNGPVLAVCGFNGSGFKLAPSIANSLVLEIEKRIGRLK